MVHLRKFLPILACLTLPLAVNTAAAEQFINTKPLLKDVVAANAGMELIIPSIVETDTNGDEHPEKITLRFKVYAAGTTNKLFSTPQKKFNPPAIPCANPQWVDTDYDITFIGENNTHTAIGFAFNVECQNNNGSFKEARSSYVYVADTSQSGSAWGKFWSRDLLSVDFIDWDDDQQDEVKIVMAAETNGAVKLKVVILDKMTGASESDKSYTAVQFTN